MYRKADVNIGGKDRSTCSRGIRTDLCLAPESAASIAGLAITNVGLAQSKVVDTSDVDRSGRGVRLRG